MRCRACNEGPLNRKETSRKSLITGEYFDLCEKCFETIRDQVDRVVESPLEDEKEEEKQDEQGELLTP